MPIFGFTILRNGIKYDYPFLESILSLTDLCEKVYIALGKSEDGTEERIQKLTESYNIEIIHTTWDETLRKSGLILSQQTNIALEKLRQNHPKGWGIYLQADEVLSKKEFLQIKSDLESAENQQCDSVSFRYLHFWQSYHQIAIGKRWYPQEVRAIRLESHIQSYGDAQGFRPVIKPYFSDAHVFHYGHVREPEAYQRKLSDFHRWWHSDTELASVMEKGKKQDTKEKVVAYLGPHPLHMEKRIHPLPNIELQNLIVYGDPSKYASLKISANLHWTQNPTEILAAPAEKVVLLDHLPIWASAFSKLRQLICFSHSLSPLINSMHSPNARPWTKPFTAIIRFSQKGVRVSD